MPRARRLVARFSAQLLRAVLIRSLRGSLLIGGATLALASTGLWQYLASSFNAHDARRAAAWSAPPGGGGVVLVAIDEAGFDGFFGGRSPLDRNRLVALLGAVHASAPQAEALVVDIDLSPAPGETGAALAAFFRDHDPRRWVLADPVLVTPDPSAARSAWRQELCALGVRMAAPYQPTDFGYASMSHQFGAALTTAALDPGYGCARHLSRLAAEGGRLARAPSPSSPVWLRDGVVLPFTGDLQMLRHALVALQPRVVVIGGTWGRLDVAGTPFGERYGAHLHAAGLQGKLDGLRMAPHAVQLAVAWVGVSLLSVVFALIFQRLATWTDPWVAAHPGHRFLMTRLWPLSLMVLTFGGLLLLAEALAFVYARTGYWIPSATVAATVAVSVLFVWNWGLNRMALDADLRSAWRDVVVGPIVQDSRGMALAWRVVRGDPGTMSRLRAAGEVTLAGLSLLSQTLLPLLALGYAVTKPL